MDTLGKEVQLTDRQPTFPKPVKTECLAVLDSINIRFCDTLNPRLARCQINFFFFFGRSYLLSHVTRSLPLTEPMDLELGAGSI